MATAGRTLSPGGALLRASRMFSLPQAMPPPPGDYQAATSYNSDTATMAFPTLQTVTAPEKFRQRGDWGFKRNFPLRSTATTSTPYLRVRQVDSIEHVTDFASAADHTLSLEKWQEMNIPLSLPHSIPDAPTSSVTGMELRPESVFESKYDFTALDEEKIKRSGRMRWKYKGPWLAKLTEGEFQKYIKKVVRPRRSQFRQFLREQLAARLTKNARRRAVEAGGSEEVNEADTVQQVEPSSISDHQLTDFFRELVGQRQTLMDLVGEFLDLAPIVPPLLVDYLGALSLGESRVVESDNPYALHGPPITHPSAGLSYLRTSAFLHNHFAYGPQKYHAPVKGRIFISSSDVVSFGKTGTLGVNGFIVGQRSSAPDHRSSNNADKFDVTIEGGPKMWVHVYSAQINSQGRVLLRIEEVRERTSGESKLVQEEMQGEKQVFRKASEENHEDVTRAPKSSPYINNRGRYVNSTVTPGSREGYGLGSRPI